MSHVAWTTGDLDAESAHLGNAGCALLTTSVGGGAVANWYSGGPLFGHAIEVHEPTPGVQEFWKSLRETNR